MFPLSEETWRVIVPVMITAAVTLIVGVLGVSGTLIYFRRNAKAEVAIKEISGKKLEFESLKTKAEANAIEFKLERERIEFEANDETQDYEFIGKVLEVAQSRGEEIVKLSEQGLKSLKEIHDGKKRIQELEADKYRLEGQLIYQESQMEKTFKKNDNLIAEKTRLEKELEAVNQELNKLIENHSKKMNDINFKKL